MSDKSSANRHKSITEVWLTLSGQRPVEASVFLNIGERLIDLLNDARNFIPVLKEDGEAMIVAKTQIISVIERDLIVGDSEKKNDSKSKSTFDPYIALRISKDASLEEIRQAYKARIKAVHPDSIAGLDLDDDLARAALQATQRVNYAYKKILAERDDIMRGSSHDDEETAA